MRIVFKETFIIRLENQIEYITLESPKRAKKFKSELMIRIRGIQKNPYLFRKSIYFENKAIRDLVFKGYTIVFRITEDTIEIFGFVKYQNDPC